MRAPYIALGLTVAFPSDLTSVLVLLADYHSVVCHALSSSEPKYAVRIVVLLQQEQIRCLHNLYAVKIATRDSQGYHLLAIHGLVLVCTAACHLERARHTPDDLAYTANSVRQVLRLSQCKDVAWR